MNKTALRKYLLSRKAQIMSQLKELNEELTIINQFVSESGNKGSEDKNSETSFNLVSEVVDIMESGNGPWTKRQLAVAIYEENPKLPIPYRALINRLATMLMVNPRFKKVEQAKWVLTTK